MNTLSRVGKIARLPFAASMAGWHVDGARREEWRIGTFRITRAWRSEDFGEGGGQAAGVRTIDVCLFVFCAREVVEPALMRLADGACGDGRGAPRGNPQDIGGPSTPPVLPRFAQDDKGGRTALALRAMRNLTTGRGVIFGRMTNF